jgi:DNA polymerase III delta subunit
MEYYIIKKGVINMFFIYSKDLFLLNKQLNKLIKNIKIENQETEVKKYS